MQKDWLISKLETSTSIFSTKSSGRHSTLTVDLKVSKLPNFFKPIGEPTYVKGIETVTGFPFFNS